MVAVSKRSRLVDQIRAIDRAVIGVPSAKGGSSMWRMLAKKQ